MLHSSAYLNRPENAKKEAEEQRAIMPSLEFVSVEIKALKRALILVRRQNSELLAREGYKRLRTMLPPISCLDEILLHPIALKQQLQQDQDIDEEVTVTRNNKHQNSSGLSNFSKLNVELLDQLQATKASNKVIKLIRCFARLRLIAYSSVT